MAIKSMLTFPIRQKRDSNSDLLFNYANLMFSTKRFNIISINTFLFDSGISIQFLRLNSHGCYSSLYASNVTLAEHRLLVGAKHYSQKHRLCTPAFPEHRNRMAFLRLVLRNRNHHTRHKATGEKQQ